MTLSEEWVDYPLAQRVDGQLRDAEEILSGEGATVILVQWSESRVKPLNLVWCDWKVKQVKVYILFWCMVPG